MRVYAMILLVMPLALAFLGPSERYMESLRPRKPAGRKYIDSISVVNRPLRRREKRPLPHNQTVVMNATFVINQISANEQVRPLKAPSSKTTAVSDAGNFHLQEVSSYNFSSIGGYAEIKLEMNQMLDMLRNVEDYKAYNVRIPKGILFHGPPGNGKTLLARCFAGESALPIIATSGSEFQEKYVGTGPARIRELFSFARSHAPCMVFIDEIDALARRRGTDGEAAQAERDSTLNQLLVELDGFSSGADDRLFVIASTNRIDILDPALLRPGRMDKNIHVPLPDPDTRRDILKIHLNQKPIMSDLEWMVHDLTIGMSGAEIEHLLNEAVLHGIRRKHLPVNDTVLETVRDMHMIGQEAQPLVPSEGDVAYRVAIHEMGHVLVALHCAHHENPRKCSILSNKKMLGFTLFPPRNESLMTFNGLSDRIKVLLGGRIAEEIVFGACAVSTGAADDLHQCQKIAHDMVLLYGMGDHIVYPRLSDAAKKDIDDAVLSLVSYRYDEAKRILLEYSDQLIRLSHDLMEKHTMLLDEILERIDIKK